MAPAAWLYRQRLARLFPERSWSFPPSPALKIGNGSHILEALPAILLGFVVLKVLTDSPEKAKWLAPEEREWLVATLKAEDQDSKSRAGHTVDAWRALRDPRVLALAAIYLGTSAGLSALQGLWSPLILRQFSFSPLAIGWINAVPGVLAIVGMVAWSAPLRPDGGSGVHGTWFFLVLPPAWASSGLEVRPRQSPSSLRW